MLEMAELSQAYVELHEISIGEKDSIPIGFRG